MPIYLDHHKGVPTPAMIKAAKDAVASGGKSPLGTKALNGFVSKTESWCLNEAPNAAAVHSLHEQIGMKLGPGDVVEVGTLLLSVNYQ